uniref:Pulmonary surfactant-associated protein B n=1 Tax=Anas platyrhynchos TaxID=8839 RepID=A0A8B9R202_ANAPL
MALPPSPSPSPSLVRTLLLALLCATTGLGGPAERCGVPPDAWCQSWGTALRCGALELCARRGWAPSAKEDMCADCQEVVTLLIRMANESATKVAVEGFLRRECSALPVPTMVTPCQNLVHEYLALLVTHLEQHLGQDLPVPMPLCWLCRNFISRLEASIPKEAAAAAVSRLCRVLPVVVAGTCQCLAERYTVLVLEAVLGRLGPRLLCRLLLACHPEDDGCAPLAPPRPPGDQEDAALRAGHEVRAGVGVGGEGLGGGEPRVWWGTQGWHGARWGAPGWHGTGGRARDTKGQRGPKGRMAKVSRCQGTCQEPKRLSRPQGRTPGCHHPEEHTPGCHSPRGHSRSVKGTSRPQGTHPRVPQANVPVSQPQKVPQLQGLWHCPQRGHHGARQDPSKRVTSPRDNPGAVTGPPKGCPRPCCHPVSPPCRTRSCPQSQDPAPWARPIGAPAPRPPGAAR